MKKKYVSPLFAELEIEDVLYLSEEDIIINDDDEPGWGDFGDEEDFDF